jgi:predicted  nucleic acid-binding Zn-ribbon protein
MAKQVTIERFKTWVADPQNVDALLDLVAGGMTLRNAAMALGQPYTCAHQYLHSTAELAARYDAARKAWADHNMDEAIAIADEVVADKDEVAKAKLRVEARQVQAKAYNRERWGDKVSVEKNVNINVDAALLASVDDLLRLANEKVVKELPAPVPALDMVEATQESE